MKMRRGVLSTLLVLLMIGGAGAATYHFSLDGSVTVQQSNVSVSPGGFNADLTTDTEFVKEFDVENTGSAVEVYFDDVLEGPDTDNVSVSFTTTEGDTVHSSDRLHLPAGTESDPSETGVHMHIDVDDDAASGDYDVYVQAKET